MRAWLQRAAETIQSLMSLETHNGNRTSRLSTRHLGQTKAVLPGRGRELGGGSPRGEGWGQRVGPLPIAFLDLANKKLKTDMISRFPKDTQNLVLE